MLFFVSVLCAALAAAVTALVVVRVQGDRARADVAAERDEALAAAVEAMVTRAGHVLAEERHATVQAAVDNVVTVATSKLGDTVQAGSRELDLRSQSFEKHAERIGQALTGLATQVAELQRDRAEQSGSLTARLAEVARTQTDLAEHTSQLRQALASPKQRGQWGERMAEDVLHAAGLQEGISYHKQKAIAGGTIPDFRFLLPRGLELRMDVKFPVDNYLKVLDADAADQVARHTKAFVADVRGHIRSLAGRGYIDPSDTVDCLLLFIPNEAVYGFLHEADPDVVDHALGQQVVLCSPSTLFAVLAVVRRSVEQFQLERRSDEILRCLGGIQAEWDKYTGAVDKLGKQLDTVHKTFHDEVDGTRRRQFQRTLDRVDSLAELDGPAISVDDSALSAGEALAAKKAVGDVRPLPLDGTDGGVADAG